MVSVLTWRFVNPVLAMPIQISPESLLLKTPLFVPVYTVLVFLSIASAFMYGLFKPLAAAVQVAPAFTLLNIPPSGPLPQGEQHANTPLRETKHG